MSADAERVETGRNITPTQGYDEILLQSIKSESPSLFFSLAASASLRFPAGR